MDSNILPKTSSKILILSIVGISIGLSLIFFYNTSNEKISSGDVAELSLGLSEYLDSSDKKIRNFTSENQFANTIRKQCGIDEYCTVEMLQNLSREQSSEIVLMTASDIISSYKKNGIVCHNQGHHIGGFLYGQIGDLKQAILQADNACGGSVYHGILENYMRSEIFFEDLSPTDITLASICDDLDDLNIQIRTECHHGLGHALAIVYDFDVIAAAKRCDEFENKVEQRFCHEGVFMENTQEIMHNKEGAFDKKDILNPCNQLDDMYVRSCYYHHATYILAETGSAKESFKICDTVKQNIGIRACYLGLGRQLAAGFLDNMEGLDSICKLGQTNYQTDCFTGALSSMLDDLGTDEGFKTCKAFPEREKERCYSIMGKWVYTLYSSEEERKIHCSKAERDEFYNLCISQVVKP